MSCRRCLHLRERVSLCVQLPNNYAQLGDLLGLVEWRRQGHLLVKQRAHGRVLSENAADAAKASGQAR